jgi:hypothetical protein
MSPEVTAAIIAQHLREDAAVSWQSLTFEFTGVALGGADFRSARFSSGVVYFAAAKFFGPYQVTRSGNVGEGRAPRGLLLCASNGSRSMNDRSWSAMPGLLGGKVIGSCRGGEHGCRW